MAKYVFVMGGVLSSLGKGIATASIGMLLKRMGYSVGMQKLDPYLNVDPGTMSPFQHGEVFVTDDGAETDLDLGHYERFLDQPFDKYSSSSAGQVYENVLLKERRGDYLGKTVQVIPHVTNEIKERIFKHDKKYDIVLTEIGGTVGDIESLPFLEAVRQFRLDVGVQNSLFILLTYVPYIKAAGELKTKPSQHSAYKLREIGIQPDILLCRSEKSFDEDIYNKIALFTNVPRDHVFNAIDVKYVYEVPIMFLKQGVPGMICKYFKIKRPKPQLKDWLEFTYNQSHAKKEVTIAVCGKYVKHQDAYKSVEESLIHAAACNKLKLKIKWVDSEDTVSTANIAKELKDVDGVLIPGGFGVRGIEGKIAIVQYARENHIPFFGICLGMQVAAIEYARHICKMKDANSTEFNPHTKYPVIALMEDQQYLEKMGGTMRLGAFPCKIKAKTLAYSIYGSGTISERHRHRYEVNNAYREKLEDKGLMISGLSPDKVLVEIIELPSHPFYIGVQFHPEFKSSPTNPQPIFAAFIRAAYYFKTSNKGK
ncbi:MAG TPA: CTP synthase [Candidatus Cloacimonadota bacterium]|nr:CTP synthase [Candidatus Cloacimonadota bacterium]